MSPTCRDVVATCFGANFRRAARILTQSYDDALRPAGLRLTQFTLLAALHVRGELTVSRFADMMAMERSALARNLKPLERRGLVQLSKGSDRRTRLATLTERGRDVVEAAVPLWQTAQARILDQLNVREQKQLATSLELVTSALDQR